MTKSQKLLNGEHVGSRPLCKLPQPPARVAQDGGLALLHRPPGGSSLSSSPNTAKAVAPRPRDSHPPRPTAILASPRSQNDTGNPGGRETTKLREDEEEVAGF